MAYFTATVGFLIAMIGSAVRVNDRCPFALYVYLYIPLFFFSVSFVYGNLKHEIVRLRSYTVLHVHGRAMSYPAAMHKYAQPKSIENSTFLLFYLFLKITFWA